MPGIDVSKISLELAKVVVKNGKVDLNLLEEVASGKGFYSKSLVFEANNILMSALNGDKAWGDVGDQFVSRRANSPVSEEKYTDMLKKQTIPDRKLLYYFSNAFEQFLHENADKLEGKYIPNFVDPSDNHSIYEDVIDELYAYSRIPIVFVLSNPSALEYVYTDMLLDNRPTNEEFVQLEEGLSAISELYKEFVESLTEEDIRNKIRSKTEELKSLENERENLQKRLDEIDRRRSSIKSSIERSSERSIIYKDILK